MPTNITEVEAFTAPVTVPTGGDPRTAASVVGAFQALADRTLWLGTKMRVVNVADAANNSNSQHEVISATSMTDITGASVSATLGVGDFVLAFGSFTAVPDAYESNELFTPFADISLQSTSLAQTILGSSLTRIPVSDSGAANAPMSVRLFGYAVAGFAETYTFKLRAQKNASGQDLEIRNDWSLTVITMRPNP